MSATTPKLYIEEAGSGPPLLLIAGLGYASWCWRQLSQALQAEYRVITFDNRGAGQSDKPEGPYSMAMLADDAARVLDQCQVTQAHVLGHSMGGYITLNLAKAHPDRIRSLILVSTSGGGPGTLPVPDSTMAAWAAAGAMAPQDYARMSMPHSFAPGWAQAHPEAFEALLAERLKFPTPANCWQAQFDACVTHVVEGLDVRGLNHPALVLHGLQDRVVPWQNGRRLADRLPQARWQDIPQAGHLPYLEDPEGFVSLLRPFLAAVPQP